MMDAQGRLWPADFRLQVVEAKSLAGKVSPAFEGYLAEEALPESLAAELERIYLPLCLWLRQLIQRDRPLFVGVNGAQGSGKSTLCQILSFLLANNFNLRCVTLSIDDLYLTKAERLRLAADIHPLLVTRGVPGTHDCALGHRVFDALENASEASETLIPRFDKASDDRTPEQKWFSFVGRPAIVFFEGWCVGATPQDADALCEPLNDLEEREDPDGSWRRYANRQLEHYQTLFSRLDQLLMLKIPDWEMVLEWRSRQEERLARQHSGDGVMDAAALRRFIMHYERLTRHQLMEMPGRADLVFALDRQQRVKRITKKAARA